MEETKKMMLGAIITITSNIISHYLTKLLDDILTKKKKDVKAKRKGKTKEDSS